MMFFACKLNKQGDNIQSCTYSFLNLETICCFMSHSNYCLLTCIQVSQEAGNVVWYYYLFKNFLQSVVIHTVKNFRELDEADVFFWNSLAFLYDPMDVGDLIAGSSAFTKIHLIHLEVLSSHTVEAYLERF